jgi:TIR domain
MRIDPSQPRLRVRWWRDGISYAAVRDADRWRFYEKEAETVRWFEVSSTPDLCATAETVLLSGENVEALPAEDEAEQPHGAKVESSKPTIFICYAKEDRDEADTLFRRLRKAGFDPWMDEHRLVLGDDWEPELKKAVMACDAFFPCLRSGFDEIGFRQQEVRWALDALRNRPPGRGFIVPFIVEPCSLPEWCKPFHAGNHLHGRTRFEDLVKALRKHFDCRNFC